MAITTSVLTATFYEASGAPLEGVVLTALLQGIDLETKQYIVEDNQSTTSDASGVATLTLFANASGTRFSYYRITAVAPDGTVISDSNVSIPATNCNLADVEGNWSGEVFTGGSNATVTGNLTVLGNTTLNGYTGNMTSGTINNVIIGGSTPAAGTFTALVGTSGTINGNLVVTGTGQINGSATIGDAPGDTHTINGSATITGTINQTTIPTNKTLLVTTDIGVSVQAYDADLTTWAGKTAPSGTVVGDTDTQTLTNKTINLANNTLTGTLAEFNTALSDGSFVSLDGSETLTNKTLTAPVISSISNTGTLTLPISTDTLVGRATTDTLTNKTLTAPDINGGTWNGTVDGNWTAASQTCADLGAVTTADINGGTLDGVTIGGTTPAAGTFTTLSATGNVTLGDASTDTLNVGNGGLIKDASGNVGVGVTPSAWDVAATGGPIVQVKNGLFFGATSEARVIHNAYYESGNFKYISSRHATSYKQNAGVHTWETAASGTAGNAITWTTAMTLDASGYLSIGPGGTGSNHSVFSLDGSNASNYGPFVRFKNNSSMLADIGDYAAIVGSATHQLAARCGGSGGVYLASTATAWSAVSDETKKDIIEPIGNALSSVNSWRSIVGKYKSDEDGKRRLFLIAQDVRATNPEAVTEDAEGILGLQYTDTIPVLVAAIKELSTELNTVKSENDALKARLDAAGL